ncbi:hypothetical protein [Ruminiclostridium papyrosolvens]|uniref:Uncharacterized protein n=1 Tax=Ruminiclostridium papyrosolvens C7 TaxID=1330534 RepID=U4QWV4_9FIRM|nr:hypothetical protein [Ruminiclostridium papyrosolvens]EPR07788.1 hypothetical protein L323_20020 [Ruminiclostridium papyrosolvens C7]
MKTTLQYLLERKDLAWHNRLCYSMTYEMDTPKEGYRNEHSEAVRDCEIVEELITMVKAKEAEEAELQGIRLLDKGYSPVY